jgi:hypothetical protein
MYVPTDWGAVERDSHAWLTSNLLPDDIRQVQSAFSEEVADQAAKAFPSIFTVSLGCVAQRSNRSGGGYLKLDETFTLEVYLYGSTGKSDESGRWPLQTLAAKVKGVLNGYVPQGQVDNDGFLELRRDEPVQQYLTKAGTLGLKVRQTYTLANILISQVVGVAAA